jgi:hypothetical protein
VNWFCWKLEQNLALIQPQGGGPNGEGLGLGGMLPTKSKVQHLFGAFNPLGHWTGGI